jgi:myo-inositol 2-dehydrogenase/D-chiro-inositol 1-dehydrogenase
MTPLRFGLIGYGLWGRHHAQAIRKAPGASLTAIACRSEATAAAARRDFPEASVYRHYRELLARENVDAVDIVVPNHLHAEIGVAALEHGKDVLLEKPMAVTPGECDRLIGVARRSGRVLSIGHELRLSPQWGRIKALLDTGEIGEPLYVSVSLFRFPYRQGAEGWRYVREQVGSWILEEPVHAFDVVMWYFDAVGDPTALVAAGNNKQRPDGMYDNFSALLRFPGGRYAAITETLAGFEYHQVAEVVGTEGAIRGWWSGPMDRTLQASFELKVLRRGSTHSETLAIDRAGEVFDLQEEIAQLVVAFRERRPLVSAEEARKRIIVCAAAERSLREGCEVPLTF